MRAGQVERLPLKEYCCQVEQRLYWLLRVVALLFVVLRLAVVWQRLQRPTLYDVQELQEVRELVLTKRALLGDFGADLQPVEETRL